jgi:hypothetical protein
VLYFHVDGGYPSEVVLYLRARKFNSLFYTELGKHGHTASVTINNASIVLTHNHTTAASETDPAGGHGHSLLIDVKEAKGDPRGVDMQDVSDCDWLPDPISTVGDHKHGITKLQIDNWVKTDTHGHTGGVTVNSNGVTDVNARTGVSALTYVNDLKIFLDGQDISAQVLQQLSAKPGQAANWAKLGDGTNAHALASPDGTGAIDLLKLGIEIGLGQHKLEFRVGQPNVGGGLQYNLYVG